nr:MAG TPA: hypothetical protein [Caudoviricetes sp.]DAO28894.1 MAG TPA: hypothetical protein [Caudoviricetes sp.]
MGVFAFGGGCGNHGPDCGEMDGIKGRYPTKLTNKYEVIRL